MARISFITPSNIYLEIAFDESDHLNSKNLNRFKIDNVCQPTIIYVNPQGAMLEV
ncbi:unnamed protein product [Acidithrix sp. C25]|nr:unnamed protein product [Acidithrix sp. C25]